MGVKLLKKTHHIIPHNLPTLMKKAMEKPSKLGALSPLRSLRTSEHLLPIKLSFQMSPISSPNGMKV
jgi:hypothetical protein